MYAGPSVSSSLSEIMSTSIGSLVGGVLPPREDAELAATEDAIICLLGVFVSGVQGSLNSLDASASILDGVGFFKPGFRTGFGFEPDESGVLEKKDVKLFCFNGSLPLSLGAMDATERMNQG